MRNGYSIFNNIHIFICLLIFFAFTPITGGQAEVTRMVVKSSGPMGTYGGREYIWVTADMYGEVAHADRDATHYRVPVVLMYPQHNANGFGFVDVINSAAFKDYEEGEAPEGKRIVYYVGDVIFSDYLRREGYVYMAVQWAKLVTHALGPDYGVIEDGRDGYRIMIDAADFLRAPVTLEGTVPFQPLPVQHVIGFGQSQTARLFWSLVHAGQNRKPDGALVFDGILAGVGGSLGGCIVFTDDETPQQHPGLPALPIFYEYQPCPGHLPPDGKYITIQTQSDIGWAYADRNQTSRYRHYELAGIAHIPPDIIDLRLAGATRQNPVSFRPFFKAALRNLADWIVANRPPPDSTYVEGKMNSDGEFEFVTDADGNVKGGVRLPHMPAILDNGEPAGAPLGVYGGLEDSKDVFVWLGGTFEPFSNEELAKRYPDRDVYVERVSKAADALLAERFILEEDHDAYIKAAQRWRR